MRRTRRDYPTGIPIQPPPGWQGRASPPPLPAPSPRGGKASPFRTQLAFVLRAVLLSLLVMVCMGMGWFLVNGRRPGPDREHTPLAKAGPKKGKVETDPAAGKASPRKTEAEKPARPSQPVSRELSYERDILPIMERACVSCHGATKKRGKLDLRTYQTLVKGGEGGSGVVPGKPEVSPLWTEIKSGSMPPRGSKKKLSAEDKEFVRAWIAGGAKSLR